MEPTLRKKHITLVAESRSNYVGHFASSSGKAEDISNGLIEFCLSYNIEFYGLCVIGCDGTHVNTSAKERVIAAAEQPLGKPF